MQRAGPSLTVDGTAFRFVGYNLYDGAASDIYSCSPSTRLDDTALAQMLRAAREEGGATVIRFWAFPTYTADGTDFSGMDRLIAAARREGLRVMPVLEDGPGDCSTGEPGVPLSEVDSGNWYITGYREPLGRSTAPTATTAPGGRALPGRADHPRVDDGQRGRDVAARGRRAYAARRFRR